MEHPPTVEDLAAADAAHDPDTCGDPSCAEAPAGSTWLGIGMSFGPDGRVRFHHREESRARLRARREQKWSAACAAYAADPGDFVTAYRWLTQHPIFHRFRVPARLEVTGDDPQRRAAAVAELQADELARVTDRGLDHVWTSVFGAEEDDEGGPAGPRILFEHGPHLWATDRDSSPRVGLGGRSSHDPDLDVVAPTYEQAIVALARKVHDRYGTDRSRV